MPRRWSSGMSARGRMPFSRSATTRRNASSSSGKAARRRDRAEDGQLVKNAPSTLIFDLCASKSSESDVKVCIYCGMSADSIDHVPPRHLRAQLAEIELLALGTKEVDACRECNSALGRRPLLTITERRRYIKGIYILHSLTILAPPMHRNHQ